MDDESFDEGFGRKEMKLKSCVAQPPDKDGLYFALNHRGLVSVLEYKEKKWYNCRGTNNIIEKEEGSEGLDCSWIDLED